MFQDTGIWLGDITQNNQNLRERNVNKLEAADGIGVFG